MAGLDVPYEGPYERDRIDSEMPSEMLVLKLDDGFGVALRDRVAGREPPLPVGSRLRAEKDAVPVHDHRRVVRTFEKVSRQGQEIPCQET